MPETKFPLIRQLIDEVEAVSNLASLKEENDRLLIQLGAFVGLASNCGWVTGTNAADFLAKHITTLERLVDQTMQEAIILRDELEQVRLRLLSAAGDDLCRLSPEEIKSLTSGEVQIPPREEFIASCERFHQQIALGAGELKNCLTLAQLIAENEMLRQQLVEQDKEINTVRERMLKLESRYAPQPLAEKNPNDL